MNCGTTKDNLGNFDPKSDNGTFLGYSKTSKAYRVYNSRTLTIEESIHVKFNDSKPNKELPKLDDSFAGFDLGFTHRLSNEISLNNGQKDDSFELVIIGDIHDKDRTRSTFKNQGQVALIYEIEPKSVDEVLLAYGWVEATKEELDQF
ncbi:hypothetical protein CR513_57208, partial [Mucuna pruriens]